MAKGSLPTWFAIALDYLPIQASAVPSERVFSSSAQTDTPRRNRIQPILMESLQMLKFGMLISCRYNFVSTFLCRSEKESVEFYGRLDDKTERDG